MAYDFDNEKLEIISIYNDNYILVKYLGIEMIYSVKDDKVNATKICEQFGSCFRKWFETKGGKKLREMFPEKFKLHNNVKNELKGTYITTDLINVILCWADPLIGYYISNCYSIPDNVKTLSTYKKTKGFIYFIQPEKYLGTNIYKIGRTWNLKMRFRKYGINSKTLFTIEVNNMFEIERKLIWRIEDLEYEFVENTKEYFKLNENEDVEELAKYLEKEIIEMNEK